MSLSPIRGNRKVRQFLTYDLEWVPGTLQIRCVGVYDGDDYRCYKSVAAFLDNELTSRNRGKWFYAHAGGLADFQFIFSEMLASMRERGYRVEGHFSGSSLIIATVTRGHNVWTFLDSYWLLKDKLAKIANWIGQDKGGGGYKEDFKDPEEEGISDAEYEVRAQGRREWYATTAFEKLRSYNERDCTILHDAIRLFQDSLLEIGGQLQMTLASCSMQLFRRKYLHQEIETSSQINAVAKEAYTASRVEDIESPMFGGFYFDINSSFPYAMTKPAPGRYIGVSKRLPDNPEAIYLAKVRVSVPDMHIPPLPFRIKSRVFFPVGEWEAWITSVDIEALRDCGGKILKVYEVLSFEPFNDLAQFAVDIYNRRRDSEDDWEKIVLKFLLNSLYGKFAESSVKDELLLSPLTIDRKTMHMLMPGVWVQEKIVSIPHAHFPISAHITAVARQVLGNFLNACNTAYYCDTDGFATDTEFETSKELGGLKLEKLVHRGVFVAPKVYSLEGLSQAKDGSWKPKSYYRAKGFSRMTATRFARIQEGEAIEYERMTRLRENLRKGRMYPTESRVSKKLQSRSLYSSGYDPGKHPIPKRHKYPDGSSRPWSVDEIGDMV